MRALGVGESFSEHVTNPLVVAVQLAVIAALVVLIRVDWARWLGRP